MCGIFGHITKNVNSLSIPEVNMLGIINVERGRNSCGLTYDGEIFLGLDKDKIYTDFIKKRVIKPKSFPTIFGHTRNSSVGTVNIYNTHPFGFGELENGSFEFIGCHNGTLKNYEELAEKYGVNINEAYKPNGENYTTTRKKIDSEILLEILYKTKSYKVLSDYIGGAALAWTWCAQPNKMYLWSGASKQWDSSKEMIEERPLCIYQRNKNSTFFSSIEESLHALGGNETNTFQIDFNTVYIITDGDFKNAEKIPVSRRHATQNEVINYTKKQTGFAPTNTRRWPSDDSDTSDYEDLWSGIVQGSPLHMPSTGSYNVFNKDNKGELNIHYESHFLEPDKRYGKIYFHKLRYWRNGHAVSGIYTYIQGYGFYNLGISMMEAKNSISYNTGIKFVNGAFDKLAKAKDKGIIPFKLGSKPSFFYFVQGVMVRTFTDYAKLMRDVDKLPATIKYLTTVDMSYCAKHPVISATIAGKADSQCAFLDGKLFSGTVCPLGSERVYGFNRGNLVTMNVRKDIIVGSEVLVMQLGPSTEPGKGVFNKEILTESQKEIENLETLYEESKNPAGTSTKSMEEIIENQFDTDDPTVYNEETDKMISEFIDDELNEPIMLLNKTKGLLQEFLPNKTAKEGIDVIEKINGILTTFMVEPKN